MNDSEICETLISEPSSASEFLTTLTCQQEIPGDINGDTLVNVQDVILAVNLVLAAEYSESADLNMDGAVNVQDVVLVLNLILN